MTTPDVIGLLGFTAFCVAMFAPSLVQRARHRRARARLRDALLASLRADLVRVATQRDHYRRRYTEAAARNAIFLQRFGGETPLGLGADVAAEAAAQSGRLAYEWFDLSQDERR